jgi:cell division protein FtsW
MLFIVLAGGVYLSMHDDYSRARIVTMWNPWLDPYGDGYQLTQGFIAFGLGGLGGTGVGMSMQKYSYLPEAHNDFIFAIVGEDFGLLGCIAVIALFVALMVAGYRVAIACRDKFGTLLAAGITSSITVQAFLNMGVVVGILPTTGLPLPFFSAGGTSVSITMAAMGVLMNISRTAGKMDC